MRTFLRSNIFPSSPQKKKKCSSESKKHFEKIFRLANGQTGLHITWASVVGRAASAIRSLAPFWAHRVATSPINPASRMVRPACSSSHFERLRRNYNAIHIQEQLLSSCSWHFDGLFTLKKLWSIGCTTCFFYFSSFCQSLALNQRCRGIFFLYTSGCDGRLAVALCKTCFCSII